MGSKTKPISPRAVEYVAARFKALSEPNRLLLLMALGQEEKSVGELGAEVRLEQANASRHLQTLTRAGILSRRKDGMNVYYKVSDESIFHICDIVCGSMKAQLRNHAEVFR